VSAASGGEIKEDEAVESLFLLIRQCPIANA
jgi:hypothetical protein